MKKDFKKHWAAFVLLGKIRTYVDKYASYNKEAQVINFQVKKGGKWCKKTMDAKEVKRVFLEIYPPEGGGLIHY